MTTLFTINFLLSFSRFPFFYALIWYLGHACLLSVKTVFILSLQFEPSVQSNCSLYLHFVLTKLLCEHLIYSAVKLGGIETCQC